MNPHTQVNRDYWHSFYTGWGAKTKPRTESYNVNRRWIAFHARFYTQMDGYDASYSIGRRDTNGHTLADQLTNESREHEFTKDLLGFDTANLGGKQIPTMQIYLAGYRNWEQILQVNDYVALQVEEQYPDSSTWLNQASADPYSYYGIERRTLMTGLISNIHMSADSTQNGIEYVVTCQGMQKILNNINLGLPKTAQLASTNLLYDINGASNPMNETFQFGVGASGSGGSSKSSGSHGGSYGLSGAAGQIASCLSGSPYNCSKAQIAGAIGNAAQESGGQNWKNINPKIGNGGLWQNNSSTGIGSKSVSDQTNALIGSGGKAHSSFESFKSDTSGSSDPVKCCDSWCSHIEEPQASIHTPAVAISTRESNAKSVYSVMH